MLKNDINILPKVLPLYELLFDYFDNTCIQVESSQIFLSIIEENPFMFDYFIITDLKGFYKIKKIIKIILNSELSNNTEIKNKIDKIKYFFIKFRQKITQVEDTQDDFIKFV